MNFIESVGNLKLFYRYDYCLGAYTSIYAMNGSDFVAREDFTGHCSGSELTHCVESFLLRNLNIVTYQTIAAAVQNIKSEYCGSLLSGTISGFSGGTDYFKRIDNTKYYKHYVDRPEM